MATESPEKESLLEEKKEKSKVFLIAGMLCWTICLVTYAYQYMGGFVYWPYWCLIHLMSSYTPIITIADDIPPPENFVPLPIKLLLFLASFSLPLLTTTAYRPTDYFYIAFFFMFLDMYGLACVASLRRPKYTLYWPFIWLLSGFALSFGYGLNAVTNPLWCKIVVSCSALALAALSTFYLHLHEAPHHVTLARCFV